MSFGSVLKELRKKKNMTQEQLAQKLSISPQAVSRWETDFAMPDISLIVPIAELFEVSTDLLLGKEDKEFDLNEFQCFEGKQGFREGLLALRLVNTVHSCELIEQILKLVFEDENYLDFHGVWLDVLIMKARLLNSEGKYEESITALRQAQFHAKELDKVEFEQAHTSKAFKGLICAVEPRYQTHCNLYHINTAIVRDQENYLHEEHYQKLVEEIKVEGTYCKEP
jgi:transcriptional regulator with XRE-family HTH domain